MMPQQVTQAQYAANVRHHHAQQQLLAKNGAANAMAGNANSPASSDPPFNAPGQQGQLFGGPGNRMGQNNKTMGMMPPPSPGMSSAQKDQAGAGKDIKPNITGAHPEGSPRNPPQSTGQAAGPPNPGALGNPSQAPMNPPGSSVSTVDPLASVFGTDFIQSVASSMDEFDPSLFGPGSERDLNLNFERDFGQWFNPDDVGMELK